MMEELEELWLMVLPLLKLIGYSVLLGITVLVSFVFLGLPFLAVVVSVIAELL